MTLNDILNSGKTINLVSKANSSNAAPQSGTLKLSDIVGSGKKVSLVSKANAPQPSLSDSLKAGMSNDPFSQKGLQEGAPMKNIALGLGYGAEKTNEALTGNSGNPAIDTLNPLGWLSKGFGAAVKGAGFLVDKLADVTTKPLGSFLGTKAREAVGPEKIDTAMKSPIAQKTMGAVNAITGDKDLKLGLQAVDGAANLAMTLAAIGSMAPEMTKIGSSIRARLGPKYIDGSKDDWKNPTKIPKGTYRKATEIMKTAAAKGHDIPDVIVKNGIRIQDHVTEGNFDTVDTADSIRKDAGKASSEMLRPSLQLADQNPNAPKIQVSDIIKSTVQDIQKSNGTPDDIETQINAVESKGAALQRKYPNGMTLTDMHDEKIKYTSNRYSSVGPKSDANAAHVDRAFGRTLATTLESNAPTGIDVKAFNDALQKQYEAADYLESLNGKKVPVSTGAKIRNYAGKIVGVGIANTLFPGMGGILADIAGYHIGGLVESTLESMSGPLKAQFLRNLQGSNPEAFNAIQGYIQKGGTPTLALPSGQDITPSAPNMSPSVPRANVEAPMRTPAPTTFEAQSPQNSYQNSPPLSSGLKPDVSITPDVKTQLQNEVVQGGMRFRSKDGFLNSVKSNPMLANKISKAGFTPESAWQMILKEFQKMGATNPLGKGKKSFPIP